MSVPLLNGKYNNPLEHWIRIRTIQNNQNFMGVFLGETGGGKSYSAVSLGEGIDPRFNIDNITTGAKEMVDFLVDKKHPKGTTVVLDEAGVNFSSRRWMKAENKALGELFQTFRWMNVCLLFTLPNFTFLDNQQRKLCHFTFEQPNINREHNICFMKGKYIHHDDFSEKFKTYFPFIRYPDGKMCKVAKLGFRLASKDLLKNYEIKKYEWNQKLLEKTKKIVTTGKDIDTEVVGNNKKDWILKYELDGKTLRIANDVKRKIDEYLTFKGANRGWDFNTESIRADYVIKGIEVTRLKRYLKRQEEIKEYISIKNEKTKQGGKINVKKSKIYIKK